MWSGFSKEHAFNIKHIDKWLDCQLKLDLENNAGQFASENKRENDELTSLRPEAAKIERIIQNLDCNIEKYDHTK